MFYLTVGFIALTVYCVALTVVVRREINYVRNSINQCWKSIRRCWNDVDDNADDIGDIRSEVMKANEVFSDLWDRIDATVDKMLDVRVENILRERDTLEAKYRELLQKHNDQAKTCELKVEDDDFVYISDGKDEEA